MLLVSGRDRRSPSNKGKLKELPSLEVEQTNRPKKKAKQRKGKYLIFQASIFQRRALKLMGVNNNGSNHHGNLRLPHVQGLLFPGGEKGGVGPLDFHEIMSGKLN